MKKLHTTSLIRLVLAAALMIEWPPVETVRAQEDHVLTQLETAKSLYLSGNFPRALEALAVVIHAIEVREDLDGLAEQLSDAHFYLGLTYFALRDSDASLESFKAVLRLNPEYTVEGEQFAPRLLELFEEARSAVRDEPPVTKGTRPTTTKRPAGATEPASDPDSDGSKLPWVLAGVAGGGGVAATALLLRDGKAPPDFQFSCFPAQLTVDFSSVSTTCTVTARGSFAGIVALRCGGASPINCAFDTNSLTVLEGHTASTRLNIPLSLTTDTGAFTLSVSAAGQGITRQTSVQVGVSPSCSGFSARPSDRGSCANRPTGTICWGFQDGYIWRAEDFFGAPGFFLGSCDGQMIQVARGHMYDYHHVLGTELVKRTPR